MTSLYINTENEEYSKRNYRREEKKVQNDKCDCL